MTKTVFSFLIAAVLFASIAEEASADPILEFFTATTSGGSQLVSDLSLGLDFDVVAYGTTIYSLGVYDFGLDGLLSDHVVYIYDRTTGLSVASLTILAGTGTLIDGYRYITLPTPIELAEGFMGSIVVDYLSGNLDRNANVHGFLAVDPGPDVHGGGALSNVGKGRYGGPGAYPATPDGFYGGGPANRYHAGSFQFDPNPEPGTLVLLGSVGLAAAVRRRRKKKLAAAE